MAVASLVPPEKNEGLIYAIIGITFSFWFASEPPTSQNFTYWIGSVGLAASAIGVFFYVLRLDEYAINAFLRNRMNMSSSADIERAFLDFSILIESWETDLDALPELSDIKTPDHWYQLPIASMRWFGYNRERPFPYLKKYVETYIQNAVSSPSIRDQTWYVRLSMVSAVSSVFLIYKTLSLFHSLPTANLVAGFAVRAALLLVGAALLLVGLKRRWNLPKEVRYVAKYSFLQTLVSRDFLFRPERYTESTEPTSLRSELLFIQDALARANWPLFQTHCMGLSDAIRAKVDENLANYLFPAILESGLG